LQLDQLGERSISHPTNGVYPAKDSAEVHQEVARLYYVE